MPAINVPDELLSRYERLAADLDGFESSTGLLLYVLEETADEFERQATGPDDETTVDDGSVENRLRELGYIE